MFKFEKKCVLFCRYLLGNSAVQCAFGQNKGVSPKARPGKVCPSLSKLVQVGPVSGREAGVGVTSDPGQVRSISELGYGYYG